MQDAAFLNPFLNPIFTPVLYRLIGLYTLGLILIILLNKGKLKGLFSSNVGQRYLSWLVIGPLYLLFVMVGGYASLFFLFLILILAIKEVVTIASLPKSYAYGLGAISLMSVYIASFLPQYFFSIPLLSFFILTMISIKENDAKKSFIHSSVGLYASIWIIFSLVHFIPLGHLNNALDETKSLLLLIGFAVPLSDIFAYIVGRSFKKIPLLDSIKVASNLSSKKSYAGSLGNMLGAGIGIAIMYFALDAYLPLYHWIIIAVMIGFGGLIGDITESMFKRHYKVKDSGTLLPGHGGILDRIDSTLRVIVILYYYLLFFV